jgi:hypothetical protein
MWYGIDHVDGKCLAHDDNAPEQDMKFMDKRGMSPIAKRIVVRAGDPGMSGLGGQVMITVTGTTPSGEHRQFVEFSSMALCNIWLAREQSSADPVTKQ